MSTTIQVLGPVALITIRGDYDFADMEALLSFYEGTAPHLPVEAVRCAVYDGREWEWFNVMGVELFMLHWRSPTHPGHHFFCGLSDALKSFVVEMAEDAATKDPFFRRPLFFASLQEGLAHARGL
jgi:hypothetical protein